MSEPPVMPGDAATDFRLASDATMDFLANVSHELRTPLTAILGFAEVIASGMDGPVTPSQAADLATIQASSRHLLALIDDLLDVASIESGRIQLIRERVDLGELVRDAVEAIRPLAGEKGIELRLAAPPGLHEARVDPARYREIVLNLLSNAVKFSPSGGRVQVTLATLRDRGEPRLALSVGDSGFGVAPQDQDRIFEKFVRIGGPAVPGTGLGLPIARELARLHGGDLVLESTVGLGSTFTVTVPIGDVRR